MAGAHRTLTRATSWLLIVVGVAMVVLTLAQGGGPLARGMIFGVLFALLGCGRLVLARDTAPRG